LSSQLVLATNTTIQNNESMGTIRTKLNTLLAEAHNVKQPPYNAKGDGSTDDRAAIQSAFNDACNDGAPVFIPPGTYQINSSIWFCYPGLKIIGAGRQSTTLRGNFPGFILYYPDDIGGYCCIFVAIESIGVSNSSTDPGAGAIQF